MIALPQMALGNELPADPQLQETAEKSSQVEPIENQQVVDNNNLDAEPTKDANTSEEETSTILPNACEISGQFSSVSYVELKKKLETALEEKNKSLIFLDFRTLQAQVDVLVNHLLTINMSDKKETISLLEKTLTYLNQLETLLRKAKTNARLIKENHVIPLATMTSLKADYDKCQGINSEFRGIFKTLSQLNIDLTEILMISRQKILSHKETVISLIEKLENKKVDELSTQTISSQLNFIQTQINTITQTFQFDVKSLNIASAPSM